MYTTDVIDPGIFASVILLRKMASGKLVGYDSGEDSDSADNVMHRYRQAEV